jgi:UDP-2,3-diacylglucosamine hydrolase
MRNPPDDRTPISTAPFDRPGPIVFMSDAHLGADVGPRERAAWLVEMLESLPPTIGGLLIVGDLFDFWFEYRHAIPKGHFPVLHALASITRRGIPVLYFGGNHDFWAGDYLRDEIGMQVSDGPRTLSLQGRRVFVAHGDGLGRGDSGYKVLKKILRNRLCIALYRSVHPDIGIPFASRVSAISREHTEPREVILPKLIRGIAEPRLREGHDLVIVGHVHEPAHLPLAGGEFVIIGDWVQSFTYVVLDQGKITLRRYRSGAGFAGEIIEPEIVAPGSIAGR